MTLNDTLRQANDLEEKIASLQEDLDSAWQILMLSSEAHVKAYNIFRAAELALAAAQARREGKS